MGLQRPKILKSLLRLKVKICVFFSFSILIRTVNMDYLFQLQCKQVARFLPPPQTPPLSPPPSLKQPSQVNHNHLR